MDLFVCVNWHTGRAAASHECRSRDEASAATRLGYLVRQMKQWLTGRLGHGEAVTDEDFDSVYADPWVRTHSLVHWTPIAAARRAIEWLAPTPTSRVLDVGSGCGKFCLVGALSCEAHFVGVEQRVSLVRAATAAARALELSQVAFIHGDMRQVDWSGFDCVYLYNPFGELLFDASEDPVIDGKVKQSAALYEDSIRFVESRLDEMPTGTRLVTFNGFGGCVPPKYHLTQWQRFGECYLRSWTKQDKPRPLVAQPGDVGAEGCGDAQILASRDWK